MTANNLHLHVDKVVHRTIVNLCLTVHDFKIKLHSLFLINVMEIFQDKMKTTRTFLISVYPVIVRIRLVSMS